MPDSSEIPVPLALHTEVVRPEWIDHNGHMNVAYYLMAFDEASGELLNYIGLDDAYKKATNTATFVGDFHIHYVGELLEGDPLRFTQRIIACDEKRVHFWQEMYHAEKGYLAAEAEAVTLHIDMSVRRVAPMAPNVFEWVNAVRAAHAILPLPERLGRVLGVPSNSG